MSDELVERLRRNIDEIARIAEVIDRTELDADIIDKLCDRESELDDRIEALEAERDRTRQVLLAAGISDHEGGFGDTYYERPNWHMAEEAVAYMSKDADR